MTKYYNSFPVVFFLYFPSFSHWACIIVVSRREKMCVCVFLFGGNKSFQVIFWSLVFFVFLVEGMCFSFFPPHG